MDGEADENARIALSAWRLLGGHDAGRIDMRSDADRRPQFLEANPLPGLRPGQSDLAMLASQAGLSYVDLIGLIVESALKRRNPGMQSRLIVSRH